MIRLLKDAFSDDKPGEAGYDPVHLGAAILAAFTAVGALYWLLWTLLVYEGGLFLKLRAAAAVLFTSKTAADLGYEGPWNRGAFEGWFGNAAALALAVWLVVELKAMYRKPWKPTRG